VEPVNARTAIELRPVLAGNFPPMPSSQRDSVVARDLNYLQTGMESLKRQSNANNSSPVCIPEKQPLDSQTPGLSSG
jgi:hypothetical protein